MNDHTLRYLYYDVTRISPDLIPEANLCLTCNKDEQLRAEQLSGLHKEFQDTDGGMQALYELGLLKRRQWSQQDDSNLELKTKLLGETRAILTSFISLYPNSFCAEQVKKNLDDLPTVK